MTQTGHDFLDFAGRWVVVTGASQGIGRACAEEMSAHGARTILIGRDKDRLADVKASLTGGDHETAVIDLSYPDRIGPEISRIVERVGCLYGLCHAAGVVATRPLSVSTTAVVNEMMSVNVLAALELARAVARRDVIDPEGGSLVFLSSIYGRVGVAGQIGYSATKGAISSAARGMAVELARRRVRVNTVSPGVVRTPMTDAAFSVLSAEQVTTIEQKHPLGTGTALDVARAVLFLMAPATKWITGTDLVVDGGYSAQ